MPQVLAWEKEFLKFVHSEHQALWQRITDSKQLDAESEQELIEVLQQFNRDYLAKTKPQPATAAA